MHRRHDVSYALGPIGGHLIRHGSVQQHTVHELDDHVHQIRLGNRGPRLHDALADRFADLRSDRVSVFVGN